MGRRATWEMAEMKWKFLEKALDAVDATFSELCSCGFLGPCFTQCVGQPAVPGGGPRDSATGRRVAAGRARRKGRRPRRKGGAQTPGAGGRGREQGE